MGYIQVLAAYRILKSLFPAAPDSRRRQNTGSGSGISLFQYPSLRFALVT